MELIDRVLELLGSKQGESVSGGGLAHELGVSRTAVWKAVEALRERGYPISSVSGRGYILEENDILSPGSILRHVRPGLVMPHVFSELSSTNTKAKEFSDAGAPEGVLVAADSQTGGRGRLGRGFYSPPGTGLYMSIVLRPELFADEAVMITAAAAVAVASVVSAISGEEAGIKWVNDIFLRGRKICGILTEASIDFETRKPQYAVLGVGVNVSAPPGGFPGEIAQTAGAVFEKKPEGDVRSRLAGYILNRFFELYSRLPARGFMDEYRRRCFILGREVRFVRGGAEYAGTAAGVDDEARLEVINLRRADGGEVPERILLGSGEVSLTGY